MPLLPKKDQPDRPDYTLVQKAWWDAILTVYKHSDTCPMRMPLEMRIMGGSDIIMAPQRGNKLGTCAIEVLTLHSARDIWRPFAQEVLDVWMKLREGVEGGLNIRPHWAKEWRGFKVDGREWGDVLREEVYKREIEEFLTVMDGVGKEHGWTRGDLKARFGNDFLDGLFFSQQGVRGVNGKA